MSDWTDTDWGATDPAGAWQHKYEMAAAEIESLRSRLAEAERERDALLNLRHQFAEENSRLYARLAEAEALLREAHDTQWPFMADLADRIAAHLSRKEGET